MRRTSGALLQRHAPPTADPSVRHALDIMTLTPEERREARSYAWGYFALHADQRMKLFNFFLILSGLILGAFPAVRAMAPGTKLVGVLPLLLVLSAFTFWRLDVRTRHLVKNAEAALRFLDGEWPVQPSLTVARTICV